VIGQVDDPHAALTDDAGDAVSGDLPSEQRLVGRWLEHAASVCQAIAGCNPRVVHALSIHRAADDTLIARLTRYGRAGGPAIAEYRILGPLEASVDGRPVALGGARQRGLLAILLTRANEVVSSDRLIDELWGGNPPETAANAVQGYVYQLRKVLGAEAIATRANGYVVAVGDDGLDLHRLERLMDTGREALEAGDAARAGSVLREALGLWRGPPLADFEFEPFAQAEIARLEELRLAALERRIDADLRLARHLDLVPELENLVARHPLRERFRGQLVLALYRSGRQADALAAYRATREALVDTLGIEPSPWLSALEQAILTQDPALSASEPPAPAPSSSPAPAAAEGAILVVAHASASTAPLVGVAERLARRPARELILARLVREAHELTEASQQLEALRGGLAERGARARVAAFTSSSPGADLVLLATEQEADLALLEAPAELVQRGVPPKDLATVLADMPCDVALAVFRGDGVDAAGPQRPVLVPFGGAEHEWAAVEVAAWIAQAYGARLKLLGTEADPSSGRRDASRLLARAALMIQRVAAVPTEPELVAPGTEGVLRAAVGAGMVVVGLSERWREEGLGPTRLAVLREAPVSTLLVRRGLRPGGLAPRATVTRFTWTAEHARASSS
jgi:DNA-binding SARP family transcriptional activator